MRTKIAKISAGLLSILILLMVPMTAYAEDTSYTYIYDYWGDVQDGPDLYSVCKVFTSSDLKLDVKMKNPITKGVSSRPFTFRLPVIISAIQVSGDSEYDDGYDDED